MINDLLDKRRVQPGHFRLESGYHSDLWLRLDAIFASPHTIAPLVTALSELLQRHRVSAVCRPLQGGAFLAQALATALDVEFYFSRPVTPRDASSGLFAAEYSLPLEIATRVRGQRVAIVDDVISAGSSVRATASAVEKAGGTVVVVGALQVLGTVALNHFAALSIPVESLGQRAFTAWRPEDCPLCAGGVRLENP